MNGGPSRLSVEMDEFDWMNHKGPETALLPEPTLQAPVGESVRDRQMRMLTQVRNACIACSMCELGRHGVSRDGKLFRDPHVFSNQNPSRFVLTAQNPGWEEVTKCEPLVGPSGVNFFTEAAKHGVNRRDFYICNAIRCFTESNERPSQKHLERCEPFLHIEMNLLRPILVVALGAVAFEQFCPNYKFSSRLGDVTHSDKFDVDVFAIYHPSPRNLDDETRALMFRKQVKTACAIIKAIKKRSLSNVD